MQPVGGENATTYLAAVLDIIQKNAYFADNVLDWAVMRQKANIIAGRARTPADTYPAIRMVLQGIGHRHTRFVPAQPDAAQNSDSPLTLGLTVYKRESVVAHVIPGSGASDAGLQPGDVITVIDNQPIHQITDWPDFQRRQTAIKLTLTRSSADQHLEVWIPPRPLRRTVLPVGRTITNLGYIELSGLHNAENSDAYISVTRSLIAQINAEGAVRGWIIDLRRNTGGILWPQLLALGPLLGTGELGRFIQRDGSSQTWQNRDDTIMCGTETMVTLPDNSVNPVLGMVPVAVLTTALTRGAAEMLLVAFLGRDNVRSFGEATDGVPTHNEDFPLSDGACLQLTTAVSADRTGKDYFDRIEPHEAANTEWATFGTDSDPVINAARMWLSSVR